MEFFWAPNVLIDARPHPRQLRFESQRVRMVLKAFGLTRHIPDMIRAYESYWKACRLTFEGFMDFFLRFPFMMEAQSFFATTADHSWARLATLMTSFRKTFLFKRYMTLLARYERFSDPSKVILQKPIPLASRGLPLAMVFPWDGSRGGLVLHNGEPVTRGSRLVHEYLDDHGVLVRLCIERFAAWLHLLSLSGWTPDSPPPKPRARPRSERRAGAVLRPWLVRLCGPRDAYVLSWLWRVSQSGATLSERAFCKCHDGGFFVTITHSRLGKELGLSAEQVGRALESLAEQRFVTIHPTPAGTKRKTYVTVNRRAVARAKAKLLATG